MPLIYRIDNKDFTLGLWNLTESESQIFEQFVSIAPKSEIEKVEQFKYPSRKVEWMTTRLLLYLLIDKVVEIDYDKNGRPLIADFSHNISISHTRGMIAVIVAKNIAGIDIEMVSDRVLRIEDRFLCKAEKEQLPNENRAQALLLYWSAKETLYKIFGEKMLDFKKHLYIRPFEFDTKGKLFGEISTNIRSCSYQLEYFTFIVPEKDSTYLIVYYYH